MVLNIVAYFTKYFQNQESQFIVIYDSQEAFKDILNNLQIEGYNILNVKSTKNPRELLIREKILRSFDDDSWWYKQKWIIYIYGGHVKEIEESQLFLYYSNIGISYYFHSVWEILLEGSFEIAKEKLWNYEFEDHETLKNSVSSLISQLPISCYVDETGKIVKEFFWITFLNAYTEEIGMHEDSPLVNANSNSGELFDIVSVVLALIYVCDPIEPNWTAKSPFIHFIDLFSYLKNELEIKATIAKDMQKNISNLIEFIFLHATHNKQIDNKTGNSLDSHFDITLYAKKKVQKLFREWLSTNNPTLIIHFQKWAELIRYKSKIVIDKKEEFERFRKSFTYSAEIDVLLIEYLLCDLKKSSQSLEEWNILLENLIHERKKLWNKYANNWWEKVSLFANSSNSLSLKQLWVTIQSIGEILCSHNEIGSDWKINEGIAWSVESAHTKLISISNFGIFSKNQSISFIESFITNALETYPKVLSKLNSSFVDSYMQEGFFDRYPSVIKSSSKFFEDAVNLLKKDKLIGLIFIDSFRIDLADNFQNLLEHSYKRQKSKLKRDKFEQVNCYTLLPSITALGWPATLLFGGKLNILYQDSQLKVQFNDGSKVVTNPDRKRRNKRISNILKTSGKNINLITIERSKIDDSLKLLQEALLDKNSVPVPVFWHLKFDDHEKTKSDFFSEVNSELEKIRDLVMELHLLGISSIYIFTDHGFIFAENSNVLKDVPAENTDHRYTIVNREINSYKPSDYKNWILWSPQNSKLPISSEKNLTIITPKEFSVFKKLRQNERFAHGGLSFLECNIRLLNSRMDLFPRVKISSFELVEHETEKNTSKKEVIILKEVPDENKLLEFKITGTKSLKSGEKLKSIKLKAIVDYHLAKIQPYGNKTLTAGSSINYKIYFKNLTNENIITIQLLNETNKAIYIKKLTVKPEVYNIGF